jgi:uncharacterized protein (DUF58 family)
VTGWRPTGALSRSLGLGGLGLALAVAFGDAVLVVLVAPMLLLGALGLLHRPRTRPAIRSRLDHQWMHEGQGTRSRLLVSDLDGVEHVTRVAGQARFVATHPAHGRLGRLVADPGADPGTDPGIDGASGLPVLEVSPRRWGRRILGHEDVALTSRWAGYRWGPVSLPGSQLQVLPVRAPYASRAEAPQPLGLVGAHRSRRIGSGSEFSGIRPFQTGDRLRRINWRVSLREGNLHVVTARAEEDSGVLLVVDALADHGRSGGIGGAVSSLDVTVRAGAALAEHHVRRGDRVSLRAIGPRRVSVVGFGTGERHLRGLLTRLSMVGPGEPRTFGRDKPFFGVTGGTVVIVLSPMLSDAVSTATATLVRRGLPVVVIDTLPADHVPAVAEGTDPAVAGLAWRMRRLERDQVLARLASLGCPVVAWRGPGTVDDVMRRLARRAQLPQVRHS